MSDKHLPREGDLYKSIEIAGHTFDILYGYYNIAERTRGELTPIFPDFENAPKYSTEGYPLVNRIQDSCEHYQTDTGNSGDGWCADCIYFQSGCLDIGICCCIHRRQMPPLTLLHEHEQEQYPFSPALAEA